nr:uncharacterized protein LOC105087785 isoform X2 [Camelus dromedarius]
MKLEHWWNYEEGVAGEPQANREDPWADETQARCSPEEEENERGTEVKSRRGFDDSSDWVFDSQGPGRSRSLPLCAPLRSLPSRLLPSLPRPRRSPSPSPRSSGPQRPSPSEPLICPSGYQ